MLFALNLLECVVACIWLASAEPFDALQKNNFKSCEFTKEFYLFGCQMSLNVTKMLFYLAENEMIREQWLHTSYTHVPLVWKAALSSSTCHQNYPMNKFVMLNTEMVSANSDSYTKKPNKQPKSTIQKNTLHYVH